MENNLLINGDVIDVLRDWKYRAPDAIITDPPFAISNGSNTYNDWNGYTGNKGSWDGVVDLIWIDLCCNILVSGGIIAVFGTFSSLVPVYQHLEAHEFTFQSHIIWHKINPAPSVHRRMYMHAYEIILVYSKGPGWTFNYDVAKAMNNGKQMHNVWDAPVCKRVMGRTIKHPSIVERLILCLTNPGDLVLDPFCGTSSIGDIAMQHGRSYIGIDIDPEVLECQQ